MRKMFIQMSACVFIFLKVNLKILIENQVSQIYNKYILYLIKTKKKKTEKQKKIHNWSL